MARSKRPFKCRACSGTGFSACRACGGSGRRNVRKDQGRFRGGADPGKRQPEVTYEKCDRCGGSGNGRKCHLCDGGRRTS